MNREFYREASNQVLTETALRQMGAPVGNLDLMKAAGYYPLVRSTVDYDPILETVEPVGTRQFDGMRYLQSMQKVDLPLEQQEANIQHYAEEQASVARKAADSAVQSYLSAYSDIEKLTFPQQRAEVEAYRANSTVSTPVLDSLALQRGISRQEQISKAAEKVAYFDELTKVIVGKQQEYEDMIKSVAEDTAQTPRARLATLRALRFNYTLPVESE